MRKFIGWLWDRISQSSDTQTSKYLKKLAHGPIFTIVTYQGYDINGYTFYTKQQDKKSMYQNSGICVDAYDVTGQDKNMYYGQIQEIWELDFHSFKIHLFHCNWVDAIKRVVQDKYGFISVDLNRQGYKSKPFVLAKHVAQVFYVPDTTNKRLKVVISKKWQIIKVENAIDEEEFNQFDEIPPFITSMIKPRISSANEAPYLRNDHHEKVKNFKKTRLQWKVAKWLCKICSICENMTICVKIWPFVWKFDFYWIFVWNMFNVWKYGHLCENVTFIGYLCEICLMCENMSIYVKIWLLLNIWVKYAQCLKIWSFVWKCDFY
jgi:hypothetical protein